MNNPKVKRCAIVLLACLTIGLAPYVPEPHIWGKLRWIMGGAEGMKSVDWWDAVQHGLPWLILVGLVLADLTKKALLKKNRLSASAASTALIALSRSRFHVAVRPNSF